MRKISLVFMAGALCFVLSGCSSLTSIIESAQDKVDNLASFAGTDLTAATTLASTSELNDAAATQCLPVLTAWLTTIKTNADRYKEVKGAASASVYKHWAHKTINNGFPENVTLACSAMWAEQKSDFSDMVGTVKTLLGK